MRKKKINKVLIIRPDAIGDFVNITPVLSAIKRNDPGIRISLLASPANEPLARIHPLIDEVIPDWIKAGKVKNPVDYINYARELGGKRFDAALVYYNEFPYAFLAFLAGIPVRVGDKDRFPLTLLYNGGTHISNADQTRHVMEYNLQYLEAIGFDTKGSRLNLPPPPAEYPISGDPLIGIHLGYVGGTAARRTLSKGFYAETVKKISKLLPQATIVLLGSKDMEEDAKYITANLFAGAGEAENKFSPKIINLVGRTSLYELMSVISKLDVYVGVDTGPTHIAAAYGVPMVFINAVKSPKPQRWAPLYSPKVIVRFKEKCPCVCHYANCPRTICSDSVSTDEIAEGVKHLLSMNQRMNSRLNLSENSFSAFNSFSDGFLHSFYKSNSIVFISDQLPAVAKELEEKGLNVAWYPANKFNLLNLRDILDKLTVEDATIIHSTVNRPVLFKVLEWVSPTRLLTPPLIVHRDLDRVSADDLIEYYIERFRAKTHV